MCGRYARRLNEIERLRTEHEELKTRMGGEFGQEASRKMRPRNQKGVPLIFGSDLRIACEVGKDLTRRCD